MTKQTGKIIVLVFLDLLMLAVAFGAGFATARLAPEHLFESAPVSNWGLFQDVWRLVEQDFIGTLPGQQARLYSAIRGSLTALNDPYTVFVEPQTHQREKEDLQGSFGGVGVTMRRNQENEIVFTPLPDSPAIRAGLEDGDVLISVDGKVISTTMSFDDIAALVRGKVGTQVTLSIRRQGLDAPLSFTITRQVIELPSVDSRILDGAPQIGYIVINRFTERSGEEVNRAITNLRQKGAQQVILDLRDNGGGLLTAAIDVTSQFAPEGSVVLYEKQKDKPERTFKAKSGGAALDMPVVVLVNQGTASASEITAGALRDLGRAILVGEKTFGKGSVQHIYDLRDGSSLHVTAAEWFTPNRQQLTGNGLVPDVLMSRSNDDVAAGRDPQLERAIAYLKKQPG